MICRIWHGWTSRANADAYVRLLRSEIFRGIADRPIPGYHGGISPGAGTVCVWGEWVA